MDGTLAFEPASDQHARHERRWRANILASGEDRQFLQPDSMELNALTAAYREVRLTGTMEDALGTSHAVDESIDMADWRESLAQARERFVFPPEKRLAEAFVQELGKAGNLLRRDLRAIADAIRDAGAASSTPDESVEDQTGNGKHSYE